ncbi:hypothetical protein ACIGAN_07620 [Streptomyces sp. NPDC085931]|uniref:hypothetical protein n=1 Tax=Streptomyces sp. NPDC085931 TaxID=3365740 RepID=UPI0037CCD1F2
MPETTTATTELASQYIAQVSSDLEANVKEQERISADIGSLQERLASLQHDHGVLLSMQQALGIAQATPVPATETTGTADPADPAGAADTAGAVVPSPRRKKTGTAAGGQQRARKSGAAPAKSAAKKPTTRKTTAGKTTAGKTTGGKTTAGKATAGKAAAGKTPAKTTAAKTAAGETTAADATSAETTAGKTPAAKTTAGKTPAAKTSAAKTPAAKTSAGKTAVGKAPTAAKSAEPTLVELIRRHLAEQKEPRSAAEIAGSLGQAHPERDISVKVVRVTLEGLVAKSQAERSKQGRSVFYSAPADQTPATPETEAEAGPAGTDG